MRSRSTVFATLVVGLGAIAGSVLLFLLLQRALVSSAEDVASSRALDVASGVSTLSMMSVQNDLEEKTRESQLIQVIGPDGTIVASSSERANRKPLTKIRPSPGQLVIERAATLRFLAPRVPYLITVRGVDRGTDVYTVVVATALDAQRDSLERLSGYLIVFVPLTMVLVAAGTWLLVGRSLRPVEQIRRRVASIGSNRLDERLPVPRSYDEIARLAVTMNEMLQRLEMSQRVQRSFVADASHELRSPLATLDASLEIAGSDRSGKAWLDLHEVMAVEVTRMERLVDDLLLLAKADDQGLRLRREDVDLDDILANETRRLRANGSVTVEARIVPVRVTGDEARLGQLVRNLVENAAAAAHRRVRVAVSVSSAAALIEVEDDGDGVSPEERERIFDRFVRLDASRSRNSGGTGLGLAIVREIVRGHEGSVTVGVSDLGGAKFDVRLPYKEPT
ncbi:MAG: HAMP domain-containing protein [Kineosporiaceae bacterium]|nr:HAMP domain-containing protein [Aeromicrobium sp.]